MRASLIDINQVEVAGYKVARYGNHGWTLTDPEGAYLMIGEHGQVAPRQADAVAEGLLRIEIDSPRRHTAAKTHECEHGNTSSCPNDYICEMRLCGSTDETDWQAHSIYACDSRSGVDAWRSQVAPVLRRRNYETRVVRSAAV